MAVSETEWYEVLNVLEFNSDRKRMSVIVKTPQGAQGDRDPPPTHTHTHTTNTHTHTYNRMGAAVPWLTRQLGALERWRATGGARRPTGKIKLYCKGADNVIFERLAPNQLFRKETEEHLEQLAAEGLRTLCLAMAQLDPNVYAEWNKQYHAASTTIVNRGAEVRVVIQARRAQTAWADGGGSGRCDRRAWAVVPRDSRTHTCHEGGPSVAATPRGWVVDGPRGGPD